MNDATVLPQQPAAASPSATSTARETMACTICDALQEVHDVQPGQKLRCIRCGNTLLIHDGLAIDQIVAGALAMAILLISAVFLPFLQISASGLRSAASLLDTALAFSGGITAPLTLAVFMVIVVVPVIRALLLLYTLVPLRFGFPPVPGIRFAFRLSCELRPWAMAEVFIIGVAVALVKIGDLATISFGPAFWDLIFIFVIVILESGGNSEKTIWRMLEKHTAS